MQGVASDGLLHLRQQRLRVADEQIANVFAIFEFGLQQFDWTASHAALQLHDASVKRDAAVHGGEKSECSFASYVCSLNGRAIFQDGQQRENGALRTICVLEQAASLAK